MSLCFYISLFLIMYLNRKIYKSHQVASLMALINLYDEEGGDVVDKAVKFLGVCILISTVCICCTLIFENIQKYRNNYGERYSIVNNAMILDKQAGIVWEYRDSNTGFVSYLLSQ